MNETERLKILWCALNVMIEPIDIMRAIQKVVGEKELNARWAHYFDTDNTEESIRADLEKLAAAQHGVQPTADQAQSGSNRADDHQ